MLRNFLQLHSPLEHFLFSQIEEGESKITKKTKGSASQADANTQHK